MNVPKLEKEIGIKVYATHSTGIGGLLRKSPEDFVVEEILKDGTKAQIDAPVVQHVGGRGRYLVCVLVKRNFDTLLAVRAIAHKLGIDSERIQIAGIKDTHALTAQHVSIGRMLPEDVANLKLNNLRLYPLGFSNEKIHTNMLFGNYFRVTVRALCHSSSEIMKQMENVHNELQELGGCPNFYGYQRFGTTRPVTHLVGKNVLLGDLEKAALTFLAKPSPDERLDSRRAREQLWSSQNYEEALGHFPRRLVYEREMLIHLAKRSRDFVGAFHRLPKKLCQLFVQGYQSYLFNKFLSKRIQQGLPLRNAQQGEHKLIVDGQEYLALPQIGYKQAFSAGEQGDIEKEILGKEGVTLQNFRVSAVPEMSSPGGLRVALTPVIGLNIEKPKEDDSDSESLMAKLRFSLRRGSYATILLREFMKPRDPLKSGF